jgi:menaquinone-specific isochorismate synthase
MSVLAPAARDPGRLDSTDVGAAIEAALAGARSRQRATLVSTVVSVEERDLVSLYAAVEGLRHDRALLLQPAQRFGLLGLGSAWAVEAKGRERFATIEAAWSSLLAGAVLPSRPFPRGSGPLLLGGFGFSDEPAVTTLWKGFEAARFVLPELLVTMTPGGCWLTVSQVVDPDRPMAEIAERIVARWHAVVSAAHLMEPARASAGPLRLVAARPDLPVWRDSVARLAGAVGRGRIDKVVLARQADLEAARPIEVPSSLRRLEASAPESTVFAVCRDGRTFLGATPERLVSRRGRDFRSVAMAGSIRRAMDPDDDALLADALLASDKEREEHAVVVEMVSDTLAPLAERLDVAPRPAVVRLRHLQHLVTPIQGRLREPIGIIGLGERLHPTPAVAGAPRELALELIAEEEPGERGWFAGPLGWIDRHGDGELVVALRSGVVTDRRVTLLAGCGIVADSEPDLEWLESEAKLQALGSAVGELQA